MSLDTILILIALAAFAVAMVFQARWMDEDRQSFTRKRKCLTLGLFTLLITLGAVRYATSGALDWIFAPEEDGSWRAVRIDGQLVDSREFVIGVTRGQVSGGQDDCNDWGFVTLNGRRMRDTTLSICEADPIREAYWMIANADPRPDLQPDGSLRLAARGHQAIFRRCEWQRALDEPGYIERCLFD